MIVTAAGYVMTLMCAVLPGVPEAFEGAQWLRDPAFEGVPVRDLYHREKDKEEWKDRDLSGPKNVHTLFRKEITLRAKPKSALLAITGDDYYKFYINGYRVVQGPESGYPFAHPYYWLDVAEFLDAGTNALASHAYYQGLLNRVWNSADNRSGFMLSLDVTYEDGGTERFVSDDAWKCFALQAFPSGDTIGYQTQFAENIDMRLMPVGWNTAGFDDGGWNAPLIGAQDHVFTRQITPPLQITKTAPVVVRKVSEGRYFYDFGAEVVGCTRIRIQGPAGHVITVLHGEELDATGGVRWDMRANCKYQERPILSGNPDLIAFYDYRAFRYVEILDAPAEPEVWVDVRHHPFDPARVSFRSSDRSLEQIWDLCRNGVVMGSQGGFLDCPSREKGQYLGDAVISARSHLWLTGDPSLTQKTLWDFALSARIHPGLMAVAPGSFMQEIAEYSLQYPLLLREYYRHTGNVEVVRSHVDETFEGLFAYFEAHENADGLIEGMTEKWVLVDWPQNLRDDYDYDYAADKANAVLNGFYYGALRAAAELMRALGREDGPYDARADRVAQGFAKSLVNPETGLYVDAPGSKHSSLHANAVPLCFGLSQGADPARILGLVKERRLNCGVYIASYVIEACFRNGAADLGYDLLTSTDEHSWNEMLRAGATACMEAWGPEQKWNTSWCHPWSSSPIYLLAEYVLGLSPAKPGWGAVRVAPAAIKDLPEIRLSVPHPAGRITAHYRPGVGYTVTAPLNVPVKPEAPDGVSIMTRNEASHSRPESLAKEDADHLVEQGWQERVGQGLGVWVSVERQMFYLLSNLAPVWQARCATASAGSGSEAGSYKTPLGWHRVSRKVGADAPWGQVFESLKPTRVWQPGDETGEDLVLTRVLVLDGTEAGRNNGQTAEGVNVDSRARSIYIHGTNAEERIGTPSSHGCIRLLNDDVIEAFAAIPEGTPVLISERAGLHGNPDAGR
jgi:hypothetical protein